MFSSIANFTKKTTFVTHDFETHIEEVSEEETIVLKVLSESPSKKKHCEVLKTSPVTQNCISGPVSYETRICSKAQRYRRMEGRPTNLKTTSTSSRSTTTTKTSTCTTISSCVTTSRRQLPPSTVTKKTISKEVLLKLRETALDLRTTPMSKTPTLTNVQNEDVSVNNTTVVRTVVDINTLLEGSPQLDISTKFCRFAVPHLMKELETKSFEVRTPAMKEPNTDRVKWSEVLYGCLCFLCE